MCLKRKINYISDFTYSGLSEISLDPYKKLPEKQNDNYKYALDFDPLEDGKNYSFFTTTFNNYKLREYLKFNIELEK
jgi:hypothetical protein